MHIKWTTIASISLVAATFSASLPSFALLKQDAPTTAIANEVGDSLDREMANENIYKVYFPSLAMARKAAITFHNEMMEANYEAGYLVMELNAEQIAALEAFHFRIAPAADFIAERNAVLNGMRREMVKNAATSPTDGQKASIPTIPGYSCYETVEGTNTVADGFVTSYPALASISVIGSSWQKANGLGGYDLRVLKLTNSAVVGPKPKLFIQSAIHAREYATAPLVLEFARWLTSGYGTVADATWILDHHEVHMLLQANPDGRKKAETGLSWRKNTNTNYCGPTSATRGADLNRNFTYTWNSTGGSGSSGNECDLTYRGVGPASEPEVQAIETYVRSLWPDQRGSAATDAAPSTTSGIHLDIHSYGQLVLWPWGNLATPSGNGAALQTMGRKLALFNGHTPEQAIGLYATDGTSESVSYGELGVAEFTIELGTAFFQSCSSYNASIKPNNLAALKYAAKVVRTPYITPAGPDVTSLSLAGTASTTGVTAGTNVTLSGTVSDARFSNTNGTEATQAIAAAEYYIDVPHWSPGASPQALNASDGAFSSVTENITGSISTTGLAVGKHMVYVRGKDQSGAWGSVTAAFLTIK